MATDGKEKLRRAFEKVFSWYAARPFSESNLAINGISCGTGSALPSNFVYRYGVSSTMSFDMEECWEHWDGLHVIVAETSPIADAVFLSKFLGKRTCSGTADYIFLPQVDVNVPDIAEAVSEIMGGCEVLYDGRKQHDFELLQGLAFGLNHPSPISYSGPPFDGDTSEYIVNVELQRLIASLVKAVDKDMDGKSWGEYRESQLVHGAMKGLGIDPDGAEKYLYQNTFYKNHFRNMLRWQIVVEPESLPDEMKDVMVRARMANEKMFLLSCTADMSALKGEIDLFADTGDEIAKKIEHFADESGFASVLDAIASGVPMEDVIA